MCLLLAARSLTIQWQGLHGIRTQSQVEPGPDPDLSNGGCFQDAPAEDPALMVKEQHSKTVEDLGEPVSCGSLGYNVATQGIVYEQWLARRFRIAMENEAKQANNKCSV